MSTSGGLGGAGSALNPANYQLLRNSTDISATIVSVTYGFNSATSHFEAILTLAAPLQTGSFQLKVRDALRDANGNALDGDANGAAGSDFVRPFSVSEVFGIGDEFRVNTFTQNHQSQPAVATDADGDYVVVWTSVFQDGSDWGVFGRRYDAAGAPQGGEFQVNAYTTNQQDAPAVAMDAAGKFVVTWRSVGQDGSNSAIAARRYDAAGVAQGSEFIVNTYTTNDQYEPSIAMDSDGDFVIAWSSYGQDGSGLEVYAQRFDASGVAQGIEFRVNATSFNHQSSPTIAMDASGDFAVGWASYGQDGSAEAIFAQRYTAAGTPQGPEFRVNNYTTNSQRLPSIAMDADGDFVVSWSSDSQDGFGWGIYAQRYNAVGSPLGPEFRVNSYTTLNQFHPAVSIDSDGDFVVAWQSYFQDGSFFGVYGAPI